MAIPHNLYLRTTGSRGEFGISPTPCWRNLLKQLAPLLAMRQRALQVLGNSWLLATLIAIRSEKDRLRASAQIG